MINEYACGDDGGHTRLTAGAWSALARVRCPVAATTSSPPSITAVTATACGAAPARVVSR